MGQKRKSPFKGGLIWLTILFLHILLNQNLCQIQFNPILLLFAQYHSIFPYQNTKMRIDKYMVQIFLYFVETVFWENFSFFSW